MSGEAMLAAGAALAAVVAGAGYRARALTGGGALAATVVGAVVFGLGGAAWGVLLVAFFGTSSVLTGWRAAAKADAAAEAAKSGRRDVAQVLANGGVLAALGLLQALRPELALFPAAVGALAAVTADTWATEVGLLSRAPPCLITSGRPVPAGTSGGVTALGTAAALAGGLLIGVLAAALVAGAGAMAGGGGEASGVQSLASGASHAAAGHGAASRLRLAAPAAALAGVLLDSLLGATVQGISWCPACERETERRVHRCGTPAVPRRGWRRLTNDGVNFLASAAGAAAGWGVWAWSG